MDKNKVTVKVMGLHGSGKSTIIQILMERLKKLGFNSEYVLSSELENTGVATRELQAMRIESLKDRIKVEIVEVPIRSNLKANKGRDG